MNALPLNYAHIIGGLKEKIRRARQRAILSVNKELLQVYWEIGSVILEHQKDAGWGSKIIDRLSADLKTEFPDFKGFSVRNLKYMRAFAETYPAFVQRSAAQIETNNNQENIIVQQAAAQLPWGHHQVLLDKVKEPNQRNFYIEKAIENGWSRDVMIHQIETGLYERAGKTISNFTQTLPALQSDLAQQTFKNPYVFDFLALTEEIKERELEIGLIQHLKSFMLELGKGFAYVGNQKNLVVGGEDFYLDLLFYNYHLHCFVVFELKIGAFKAEYAGKLNFYVNAINEQVKGIDDKPTIGVLLCKTSNETIVKYALQNIDSPIGVADYELKKALPSQLKAEMPSIEELEKELDESYEELKTPSQKRMEALKEKLAGFKGPEIKQLATTPILKTIIKQSLLPLYKTLINKTAEIKDWFMTEDYLWEGKEKSFSDIDKLGMEWDEEFLKSKMEFNFAYRLRGFKKAGTESFNISYDLRVRLDTYWYGIILINYKDNQPFIKKLYDEQLSTAEIENIADTIHEILVTDIENRIDNLKSK